jgi:hypothetical protein
MSLLPVIGYIGEALGGYSNVEGAVNWMLGKKKKPEALPLTVPTFDPFDAKIRDAAMNDVLLNRRATTRLSTFVTGQRGTASVPEPTAIDMVIAESAASNSATKKDVKKPAYSVGVGGLEGPFRTVLG